ncbi:MAG TPA: hypothetical protein VD704_06495 [Gaiellaceae bacterium]|nr:hypothetical protein [Gaiellaceae bacterium]
MRTLVSTVILATALAAAGPAAGAADPDPAAAGCVRDVDALFWGGAQWLVLGEALAERPSPCAAYTMTVPPQDDDRTTFRQMERFDELRALGITPVAEIRWDSPTGWRAWVVGGHPRWMPGRTFYVAGQTARRRMAVRGLDVEAGETWAFNELKPEVLAGEPGARAEVLEFLRGLYDGDPGMPKARGIVFNIFVPATSGEAEVAAYKASLKSWLMDEPFWAELGGYVDVFANEVYASSLAWGEDGASLANRVRRLNDYFHHMTVLAEDAPKELDAARSFLRRTYLPLANAAWPSVLVGDTDRLSPDLMRRFVSTQAYALLHYPDSNPETAFRAGIGFGWAPVMSHAKYSPVGRDEIAARLAEALQAGTAGEPKDACGPEGARIWCNGVVEGAELNKAWTVFRDWD